jgi:hypothetical protein
VRIGRGRGGVFKCKEGLESELDVEMTEALRLSAAKFGDEEDSGDGEVSPISIIQQLRTVEDGTRS